MRILASDTTANGEYGGPIHSRAPSPHECEVRRTLSADTLYEEWFEECSSISLTVETYTVVCI
jgi:hypothetical protein